MLPEICSFYQNYGSGDYTIAWIALGRIPVWCLGYFLLLKLRNKAAKLQQTELSKFLCYTVLLSGAKSMGPMLFLIFEVLSCLADINITWDTRSSSRCNNSAFATLFLSVFLVILTVVSIGTKTIRGERGEALTYDKIAQMKLKWRQIFQAVLAAFSTLIAMYLFR